MRPILTLPWPLLLLACATAPSPQADLLPVAQADAAPASSTDLGHQVFQARCAACHGPEGKGDGPVAAMLTPPPADLTGPRPAHLRGQPGGRRAIIEHGSPGSAMTGWAGVLSPEELEAVYGFVHALRGGRGPGPS